MFSFLKNIWSVVLNLVWNIIIIILSIILPNDNFLEQEFENLNRKEVGGQEPLGDGNNGEEEE